jgi:hypothetical protein
MMAAVKKLLPAQVTVQLISIMCLIGYCQDRPLVRNKLGDIKKIKTIIERVRHGGSNQMLKELEGLWELFSDPNPAVAAVIIKDPHDVIYEGIPEILIQMGAFEPFRKSILELTESDDKQIQTAVRHWLSRMEYYPEDITDPAFLLRTDKEYILRYLKAGKLPPECYVDTIYRASPAIPLAALFYAHHLVQGKEHEEIMNACRDVRWVIHLVEVA